MSTVQRVAKNTGIIIAGNVIFRLISLIVMIYLARYLGTADFGKYSFVFAYLVFFGILTDFGLNTILVREIARDPAIAPKLIGNAYIIRGILTAFAIVLSFTIITWMSYPADTTTYIYMATWILLFQSFGGLYSSIFQVNLRMEYDIFARLVFKVLSAGLILWIIFANGTIMQIIFVLVFSEGIKTLIQYSFSRKFLRPKFAIDIGLWKHLVRESLPLALASAVWVIYYQTDIVMLSMMQGDTAVGIYSAAHKLFDPFLLIPAALMASLFPIMSALFESSHETLIKSYRLALKYILIMALPIVISVTLLSDKIILLIYGASFANSATALQILVLALVFIFASFVLIDLLIVINRQELETLCLGLCAVVNVVLNLTLIPILSYNGAAIATLFTNILLFLACFYFLSKHLQLPRVYKMLIKPVISGCIMGAFIYYFSDFNIFLLIGLAGSIYLTALLLLKTFSEEDWNILKKIISKK